jgi:C1A family cysteine protease
MSDEPKTGWLPDRFDDNDYTLRTHQITALIKQIQLLRGCSKFLKGFEETAETTKNNSRNIFGFFQKPLAKWLVGEPGTKFVEGVRDLKRDVDVILESLVSGIDLIAAQPGAGATGFKPFLPPISFEILEILKNHKLINLEEEKLNFGDYNEPRLRTIRKILHIISPVAQFEKGQELEQAISKAAVAQNINIDLSEKSVDRANIICIDPNTMYELEDANTDATLRLPLSDQISSEIHDHERKYFALPDVVDLTYWCSDVKNQGGINACTSNSVASLVEYFHNRTAGQLNKEFKPAQVSARFLYKVTRRLGEQDEKQRADLKCLLAPLSDEEAELFLHELESLKLDACDRQKKIEAVVAPENLQKFIDTMFDVGASIRQTLKALRLFGVPSYRYWPYKSKFPDFDEEPPQFCYAFAQNYQAVKYFRLDYLNRPSQPNRSQAEGLLAGSSPENQEGIRRLVLAQIKVVLAAGFPAVFGFPYDPDLFDQESATISKPNNVSELQKKLNESRTAGNRIVGHAALAVGYSDQKKAFLIQNSYGTDWGIKGYGWLPYEYVLEGLATDWWSLLNAEWVSIGNFGLDNSLGQQTPIVPTKPK